MKQKIVLFSLLLMVLLVGKIPSEADEHPFPIDPHPLRVGEKQKKPIEPKEKKKISSDQKPKHKPIQKQLREPAPQEQVKELLPERKISQEEDIFADDFDILVTQPEDRPNEVSRMAASRTREHLPAYFDHKSAVAGPLFQWGLPLTMLFQDELGALLEDFYIEADVSFYETYFALNGCGKRESIDSYIFGGPLVLEDIFLASKLGAQGKIVIEGESPPFGGVREEQYISCLSKTSMCLEAQREKLQTSINLFYLCSISSCKDWSALLGIAIPFKRVRHQFDCFQPKCGLIACHMPTLGGENGVDQFFIDNLNYLDFLTREVLCPKGLSLRCLQERRGIGDLEGYLSFLYTSQQCIRNATIGISSSFLTSKRRKGYLVWEPSLGREGSRKVSLYGGVYGSVWRPFNPFISAEFSIFTSSRRNLRLPQLKSRKEDVIIPERYQLHTVLPFQEYDTCLREFSDSLHMARVKPGSKIKMILGNEWNNIFKSPLHFTVYYQFVQKGRAKITPCDNACIYNTALVEENTNKRIHSLFFNFSGYLSERFGANLAIQHVFSGHNCYAVNKLSVSLTGNF